MDSSFQKALNTELRTSYLLMVQFLTDPRYNRRHIIGGMKTTISSTRRHGTTHHHWVIPLLVVKAMILSIAAVVAILSSTPRAMGMIPSMTLTVRQHLSTGLYLVT